MVNGKEWEVKQKEAKYIFHFPLSISQFSFLFELRGASIYTSPLLSAWPGNSPSSNEK
jgi:hypothetical protein